MKIKYQWQQLKNEFVGGSWLSVAEFFRKKGIINNSRNRLNSKGWRKTKEEYQRRIVAQIQKRSTETEVEIRMRQHRAAKYLQLKGLQKLKDSPIQTAEEARKLIVDGLEQEREALGMNDKNLRATQINIDYSPKTKLDEFIEKATYEEILEMIAEIKRLQET